jgi:SpoVK/Ycf46/Vps4 family AAA+-type ATPase
VILQNTIERDMLSPDVDVKKVATQTAALQAGDIVSLLHKARDVALQRAMQARYVPGVRLRGQPPPRLSR